MMDPYRFRHLCGRFATGIAVITSFDSADRPVGMTANSFASVSLSPPLVSVAIDHAASAHPALTSASHWTVNILDADQEALSRRFAAVDPDRFAGVGWQRSSEGGLRLDGVLAHLVCAHHDRFEIGDHTLLIGRVIGGDAADHGRPLLYYRGGYADPETL